MLAVKTAYSKVPHFIIKPLSEEDLLHIFHIASGIMMARDGYLSGGSFVQSIVNNDLGGVINRADSTSESAIKFFVYVRDFVFLNQND